MAMMQQMMTQNQMMQGQKVQTTTQVAPPPPPVMQYFISINGQQQGPFNSEILQQMIAQGKITKQTFVWKQGMTSWLSADKVEELAVFFGVTPPPPPPPPA